MQDLAVSITPEILKLIAEIDEFKGRWEALKNLAPERLNQLRKVATIESVGSSTRIEGAKLSDREVEQLMSKLDHLSFQSRDEEEVASYAEAMNLLFDAWQDVPLTENHIKQLHAVTLKYSSKDQRHRGEYKKFPNHVEAFDASGKSLGVIFETAAPFDTPRDMTALIAWVNEAQADGKLHPLLIIALFVVRFLAIHPFQDGNGRLSRILTVLLLLQAGYLYVPYASLERFIETNKDTYYLALRKTQTTLQTDTPDWEPWLLFFLRVLKAQKDSLAQKVKHEKVLADTLPRLSLTILELVKALGSLTISEAEKLTGAPRGTIKARLSALVRDGFLKRQGKARASWYTLS